MVLLLIYLAVGLLVVGILNFWADRNGAQLPHYQDVSMCLFWPVVIASSIALFVSSRIR